jgi:hypothetical protein
MKPVPHKGLLTPVPPTNWKKLSYLNEEEDCMNGLSLSSDPSCIPEWPRTTLD